MLFNVEQEVDSEDWTSSTNKSLGGAQAEIDNIKLVFFCNGDDTTQTSLFELKAICNEFKECFCVW